VQVAGLRDSGLQACAECVQVVQVAGLTKQSQLEIFEVI